MPKRRLLWRLYPSYLVITLASLVGVGWYATNSFEQFYLSQVRHDLENRAQYLERRVGEKLFSLDFEQIVAACQSLGDATDTRLMIISATGQVLADSHRDRANTEQGAIHPDSQEALRNKTTISFIRYDDALSARVALVAVPIVRGGEAIGVVRASQSIAPADKALGSIKQSILLAGLTISGLAAIIGLWVSRQITQPLTELRHGAERFARGELGYKLASPNSEELAGLADALNQMAEQLQERIGAIVRQNNEQQAVLTSMSEGMLAVDNEQRVITVNTAFGHLLNIDPVNAHGRSLQEVVRNADLRRFVTKALVCREPIEDVVVLHGDEGVLQARGAALHDASGQAIGAVVVLNDVTHFRRLENIRRDFVANVSHELKTPIAAIKGFIETLLDGAVNDPEAAERFLNIVARQADRLNAIIEDLLSLSKIEQGEDTADLVLERGPLKPALESVMHDCETKAFDRRVELQLICDDTITADINAQLFDQAISNLVENAVKYSEPGSAVQIVGSQADGEVTISVADSGCGIAPEHLPRIFERFYRVDKARSRRLGGTGLGLAIVKHIVQAHRGRISVKSTPGAGSTFTIHLPRPE